MNTSVHYKSAGPQQIEGIISQKIPGVCKESQLDAKELGVQCPAFGETCQDIWEILSIFVFCAEFADITSIGGRPGWTYFIATQQLATLDEFGQPKK